MGKRWRRAAWWCLAIFVAVAAGYPCRERDGHRRECRPEQPRWAMDTHRDRGGLEAGGRDRLRHELRGAVHDDGEDERKGQGHRLHRDVFPMSGGRLSMSGVPVCYPKKGLYRWKVANRKLTLTKLKDTCAAEVGLFSGVWTRA